MNQLLEDKHWERSPGSLNPGSVFLLLQPVWIQKSSSFTSAVGRLLPSLPLLRRLLQILAILIIGNLQIYSLNVLIASSCSFSLKGSLFNLKLWLDDSFWELWWESILTVQKNAVNALPNFHCVKYRVLCQVEVVERKRTKRNI